MVNREKCATKRRQRSLLLFTSVILILSVLAGCGGPATADLEAVDYTPLAGDDWEVSTPAEQGLDPMLVAELYYDAAELDTLYGLLVFKNEHLIAEDYFHEGSVEQKVLNQSVGKSYVSALVGIALDQGCLSSLDQKMIEFFPEIASQVHTSEPRKEQITIRDLLQMRSGYPWEESDLALWEPLASGNYLPLVAGYPLINDPGTEFHYSNLTAYILGVIVARACNTDLLSYAKEHLFSPIGADAGEWYLDRDNYYYPFFSLTARDMARLGLLYLNDGEYEGNQVVSAGWVHDSFQTYSEDAWHLRVGRNFQDIGYGYQWWSARAGEHHFNLAWGHGGQLIVVLDEFDMVIVVTADPFFRQHDDQAWKHEKANINLVSDFIASLPSE